MAAEGESTVTGAHEELESDGEGIFCHSSTLTLILSIGFGVAVMEFSEPAMALYATPTAIASAMLLHTAQLKLTARARKESS